MTPAQQALIREALDLAERMNNAVHSHEQPSAQLQFTAHLCAAIGIAFANHRALDKIVFEVRMIYREMVRTERDQNRAIKRKGLGVIDGDKP